MHAPLLTIISALLLAAAFAKEEYFTHIMSPVNGVVEKLNFTEKQPFVKGDVLIEVSYIPRKPPQAPPKPPTPLPIDFGNTFDDEGKENDGEEYPDGMSIQVNYRDSEVHSDSLDSFSNAASVDAKRLAMNGGVAKSSNDGKDPKELWKSKATDRGFVIAELVRVGDKVVVGQPLIRVYYASLAPQP